jgi:hypothetical protein
MILRKSGLNICSQSFRRKRTIARKSISAMSESAKKGRSSKMSDRVLAALRFPENGYLIEANSPEKRSSINDSSIGSSTTAVDNQEADRGGSGELADGG